MAPQKPKRPSMLQRQRQLRAQQQQVKRASSKQLPASGDSSGNSRQARGQRANTSRAQAANNQRIINRGIEGFIRRGNAQDKLDKAAQGTRGSGTRTAGAGGGLANQQKPIGPRRQLPPSTKGGNRIGNSSQPWGEQPVRQVKVRDLGSSNQIAAGPQSSQPSLSGTKTPAKLPGGTGGADTVRGSGVRTGQPGPSRAMLPPAREVASTAAKAAKGVGSLGSKLTLVGTAAAAIDQGKKVFNPKDNLLTSLQQLGRSVSKAAGDKTAPGGRPGYRQSGSSAPTKPRVGNINPKEGTGRGGPSDVKKARTQTPTKPAAASTPSSSPSPRRQASSSGSGGTTRPRSSSAPSTSSNAGMKNQDKNYRGSLFEKTFGYKPGQAPDQLKMKDNFDTKSDIYSPSTKVDGSKLDALKIDQKKVNEYTRRKRRYSD